MRSRLALLVLSLAGSLSVFGQVVELGPAPRRDVPQEAAAAKAAASRDAGSGNWYDTQDRAAIRDAYNNILVPSDNIAMGWTGSLTGCVAGDTSSAWKAAVLARIQWFRGMAGVPTGIALSTTKNQNSQKAALIMSANGQLSHSPPSNWTCYTPEGANAAGNSNICALWGYGNSDPGCVAGYVRDNGSNNQAVGHRRWLLHPNSTVMGTGDVSESQGKPRANALWVFGDMLPSRPETRESYVAWPPRGYIPYQAVPARWSFSLPGVNFSSTTITMTRGGTNITLTKLPISDGYGENTVVWEPQISLSNPGADTTYDVTISGAGGQTYNYQVIVFDPATGGGSTTQVTVNTNPTGRSIQIDGITYTAPQTFNWTSGSTHSLNVPSPQTAGGTRYTFTSWSHGGAQSQSVSPSGASAAYTANFAAEYLLTTGASPQAGGTVAASPPGSSGYYAPGTQVQLTATPANGYQFQNWSTSATTNPLTITMNAATTVTANFSQPCSYALTGGTTAFSAAGGSSSTAMTAGSGCAWTAASDSAWIQITSGNSGTGNGTIAYTVQPNSGQQQRTGSISAAGQQRVITQEAAAPTCSLSALPATFNLPAAGATANSNITSNCAWTAATAAGWIGFSTASGNGNGSVSFTVAANTGTTARNATITVTANGVSNEIAVSQAGTTPTACTLSAQPASHNLPATAANVASTITSNCSWSAATAANWITLAPGSGTLGITTQANAGTSARTATITVTANGVSSEIAVSQAGTTPAACTLTAQPASHNLPATAANATTTIGSNCTWSASTAASWLTLATGSGSLTVSAPANPSPTPRSASVLLTANGITTEVSVTQAGAPTTTCTVAADPASFSFNQAGGSGTITVTAASGCNWNAIPTVSWITATAAGNTVTFHLQPGSATRFGAITITTGATTATVNIAQTAAPGTAAALRFVPVAPCRVADTRGETGQSGAFGPPSMPGGSTRSFPIPQSTCGIPATARAYSVNVTAVPSGVLNYISLWPTGQAQPFVSTLNSFNGRIVANAALVPAGTGGAISVFASDPTHLILDINGYFVAADLGTGLAFYPVTPCRISDTRPSGGKAGSYGPPSLGAGGGRTFQVPASGCGIPAWAQAYSLNLTAVPNGPLFFLTMWPGGQNQPVVSTLNAFDGSVAANAAIVPAGAGGTISLYASNATDAVIDINGYFAPPGPGGLNFYTATPCRVADTRSGAGTFGGPAMHAGSVRAFPLAQSNCALPANAQAFAVNITAVPHGGLQFLTTWPAGAAMPLASTLNSFLGQVVANAAIVPSGTGAINVFVSNASDVIIDANGYFAP